MSGIIVFSGFGRVLLEVLQALTPLLVVFALFQLFFLRMPREALINILKALAMAVLGLALFLHGVYIGFLPTGRLMGEILGKTPMLWALIPIGFVLGFVSTMAEPAVRVLCTQVERASSGSIHRHALLYTLSLSVGAFVSLSMGRLVWGIPLHYIIVPGYLVAIGLLKFSDPTFTAIAFDSGGVSTGPMSVTFVLALAVGVANAMDNRNAVMDGFGLIALIALAPILSIMVLGILYQRRKRRGS